MVGLLLRRRALSLKNGVLRQTRWETGRNLAFASAGLGLLFGLHLGFYRLLAYLSTVPIAGPALLWKLTGMMMLATFGMVVVSSLLTSLTTLYYSFDLKFLMNAPVPLRSVFIDKSLEAIFFASWMIGLVIVPYVLALVRLNSYGFGFFAAFCALMIPFLALAASVGVSFTLLLLYLFPSSRTRDVIWVLSSLSLTSFYGFIRYAEPERLIRPDALRAVAEYINFLQAPTAPYLPSWWLTSALRSLALDQPGFWSRSALLFGAAALVYAFIVWLSGRLYFKGYSGAQEGRLRRNEHDFRPVMESRWLKPALAALFWKERTAFFRDVKHWSQLLLIMGLVFVYLFSIRSLPLDNADLRSLVSFLNVGTAGFVIAALGLRFTYPSISLEGRSWWVTRSAPVTVSDLMRQKFIFSALPMTVLALVLSLVTNRLLDADPFTSWLSAVSLLLVALTLCAMGVGYGALFPMFTVENIHQIESSVGGFVYMAASLGYVGAVIVILSWPMQMHFQQRFGRPDAWKPELAAIAFVALIVVTAVSAAVPWFMGRRALEKHEA
jgi:ABC-2 type transport system permease protein